MFHQKKILEKISSVLDATDTDYATKFTQKLYGAKHIYITGAGRSGLVAKFFAMRLMHGGFDVHLVGEVLTPNLKQGDLLIVISYTGETDSMVTLVKKAKKVGAQIALVSSKINSTLAKEADLVCQIGVEPLFQKTVGMPMGTVFELSSLIFLETIISMIIDERNISEEEMKERHSNLE